MEELGYQVTRHAYGLETAFEVISGDGGRTVNFNAEYDALPGMGHACGHNLIATASVTGFLALAYTLRRFGTDGRVQLLGTPAEEDGGGKIDLLNAGVYEKVDVSLMMCDLIPPSHRDVVQEQKELTATQTSAIRCRLHSARRLGVCRVHKRCLAQLAGLLSWRQGPCRSHAVGRRQCTGRPGFNLCERFNAATADSALGENPRCYC